MITAEHLLAAGFRKYKNGMSNGAWNNWLFQKRIRDEKGTRYFIDVIQYDWSMYSHRIGEPLAYEASVHFYTGDGEIYSVVTCMDDNIRNSIDAIEMFFDNMWSKLELGYYEID